MKLDMLSTVQSASPSGFAPRPSIGNSNVEGFVELLSKTGSEAIQTLKSAEGLSIQALAGHADVREVASAVMAAEQTLQLSMSIRDKIVSAYLELSRMQI
jgi:flagellar hook-basal body complex protein FliE